MTTKTQIMTLFALVAIVSMSTSQIAFGAQFGGEFASATQNYYCTTDLDNEIDVTSNVDACGDLAYAAGKWNSVSQSSWDLTESSTQSGSISIWTQDLGSSTLGKVYHDPGLTGPTYTTDTYIKFSDHLDFGDIGSGDSSSYNDYETVAIHEFGHLAGIAHYGTTY